MNNHTVKLKQTNMLCNKCVMHVLQALTRLDEIRELEVDLDKKLVRVVYSDERITQEMITEMVNKAIEVRVPKRHAQLNHTKDTIS